MDVGVEEGGDGNATPQAANIIREYIVLCNFSPHVHYASELLQWRAKICSIILARCPSGVRVFCPPSPAGCMVVFQRFHFNLERKVLAASRKQSQATCFAEPKLQSLVLWEGGGSHSQCCYLEVRTLLRKYEESNCILSGAALERLCLQEQEPRCSAAKFFLVTLLFLPITHCLCTLPSSTLRLCAKS